jgi:hypothetical protein
MVGDGEGLKACQSCGSKAAHPSEERVGGEEEIEPWLILHAASQMQR